MSEQLPWEDEWGFSHWVEFEPCSRHSFEKTSNGDGWVCSIAGGPYFGGSTLDKSARACTHAWCSEHGCPLPFRPRPDLSTVEGCLRAITDVGGGVQIFSQRANEREPVIAWRKDEAARWFGEPGEPWTLDALQAAARYVLGMEAKADE